MEIKNKKISIKEATKNIKTPFELMGLPIKKIEIPSNQMTDYGIYNELLSIHYDKYEMLLFTVVKNDINELNNIISSILGYN